MGDIKEIIIIVLGSGLVATLVTKFWDWINIKLNKHENASYLAMRLAFSYEKYAISMVEKLIDADNYTNSDGHAGIQFRQIPPAPEFFKDENYKTLKNEILSDILCFPQDISIFSYDIHAMQDFVEGEDAYLALCKRAVQLSLKAISISERLREQYDLPERSMVNDNLDYKGYLLEKLEALKAAY